MDVSPCCEQLHALCPVPLDFCNRVVDTKKAAHRKGGAQRAVIKNCLQYISTHLRDDLRLEELAHECGLCSRSLLPEMQGGGRLRHTGVHPPR